VCATCGAPWEPEAEGRCPFCRTELMSPQPVIVTVAAAEPPPRRLLSHIAATLDDAL
jgi:hypothetical protein